MNLSYCKSLVYYRTIVDKVDGLLKNEILVLMHHYDQRAHLSSLAKAFAAHIHKIWKGVQWLSDRVLDSRQRGSGFKPHRRHCIVSLSKTHSS